MLRILSILRDAVTDQLLARQSVGVALPNRYPRHQKQLARGHQNKQRAEAEAHGA